MFSSIYPPLLNTPNPKATTKQELADLYNFPYLGAITTRTSMLKGFAHQDNLHKYTLFEPESCHNHPESPDYRSSLNTLGYSPLPLPTYLEFLREIGAESQHKQKLVIVSVAGNDAEIVESYALICASRAQTGMNLAMEINLSCPNIPGKAPLAYAKAELQSCLQGLLKPFLQFGLPIGLKLPPYTYHQQFEDLMSVLSSLNSPAKSGPIAFLTATNTIGNSLLLDSESLNPVLAPMDLGGMAGANLHPLALGNVYTLRKLLTEHGLAQIALIGVGGVADVAGYRRMRRAGADLVGIATGMLREGKAVFQKIAQALAEHES